MRLNMIFRFLYKNCTRKTSIRSLASLVKRCLASSKLALAHLMLWLPVSANNDFLFLIVVLSEIYIRQRKMPRGKPKRKS